MIAVLWAAIGSILLGLAILHPPPREGDWRWLVLGALVCYLLTALSWWVALRRRP